MLLEPQDLNVFFRLHRTLMFFVNQRLKVIPNELGTPEEFAKLSPEVRLKVRDALTAKRDLIGSFVDENPAHFSADELDIVRSWRHLVAGKFFVFRQLKKYTVFVTPTDPSIAYGVLALSQPFEQVVGPHLPVLAQTVLLPFKDKIVYDGVMAGYGISFGPGIRRSLNESFKEAKLRHGIVASLPMSDKPMVPAKSPKPKPFPRPQLTEERDEALDVIIRLIDPFCREHLNEEYAVLCRKLATKLARKRPSPLLGGNPKTWACGIIRTIGWVNFVDDSSRKPHMKLTSIDKAFGVAESTGQGKSKTIRTMLGIRQFDHHWTLPSRMDDTMMIWMLEVNGLMMDIRRCPRQAQEIAFEKGLIPYIPADRREKVGED